MTPIRHAQYSHLHPTEGSHDRRFYLHPFFPRYEASSFPCAGFFSPCQGAGSCESEHQRGLHQQQGVDQQFPSSGSIDHSSLPTAPLAPAKDDESSSKNNIGERVASSSKWMSSKMRLMRKMVNSDRINISKPRKRELVLQDQHQSIGGTNNGNSNNNNSHHFLPSDAPVRVCSDCNTTKTPLWRSGPRGPKSLCNACGIRQRKARRAMAAAALTGGLIPAVAPVEVPKEKNQLGECGVPFKKRCKFATAGTAKKLHADEFTISFSKNSAYHPVFPQDEKEAAMLLMALSCGLIRG